jgi:hypothetical protein
VSNATIFYTKCGAAFPAAQGNARSALNAADTEDFVRPPSVTENTTALLDPAPVKAIPRDGNP